MQRWTGIIGLLVAALVTYASPAIAVVIAGSDGAINTSPPSPDPGFANVGIMSGLTGVYLRNGWVLTASHVGMGPITLDGDLFDPIPGSEVRLANESGAPPDLVVFKIYGVPALPDLEIATVPRSLNEEVILVGHGRNRGASTTWSNLEGWALETGRALRWGTNRISGVNEFVLSTTAFSTVFDRLRGPGSDAPEAQSVPGDSGGAVFAWNGSAGELVGIIFARGMPIDQPADLALFTNTSVIADLHAYRSQIVALIDQPDCDNGIDDDGDGYVDYPDDPGCSDPLGPTEVPEPGFLFAVTSGVFGMVALARARRRAPSSSIRRGEGC